MTDIDAVKLRRLDFTLLLVLEAALRLRRLTAVGAELGLTQSAVSHGVARLRAMFEDPLFVRRPDGVLPTARALALQAPVAEVLRLVSGTLKPQAPFDPATARRTFRIGAPDHEAALFLPGLTAVIEGMPGLAWAFRALTRREGLAALESGELDLTLGLLGQIPSTIAAEVLFEEHYAVVARPDLTPRRGWTLRSYAACDHVLMSVGGGTRGIVDEALERHGLTRHVAAASPYLLSVFATVAGANAITTVPRRLALRFASRFRLTVSEPPLDIRRFNVAAAWSRRNDADPGLVWLRQTLGRVVASLERAPSGRRARAHSYNSP